ncbi:MAG: Zn-dependent exopeptidase M28 [Desulfobacteraceae bacterium]|nr:M20/M25/M40 family metallo-hydrolase [Desulfobacteraceae bacterium]MBC2757590.1 Zn-dependent exopeptidase M28 [Desulfobacteraceae bacterium]
MAEELSSRSEELKKWITQIVSEIGPRWAGSPAEARAAERIRKEFGKTCDEAEIDAFSAYPRFPENSPHIILGFYILALVLYPTSRWLAFGIFAFGGAWHLLDNIFMLKFLDPIISVKRTVTNVIGKIHPSEETKKILILSAHHDSPNCYRIWDDDFKGKKYLRLMLITEVIVYSFLFFTLAGSIAGSFFEIYVYNGITYVDILWIPFAFAAIYILWYCKLFTPYAPGSGANDNLAAVAALIGVGRSLARKRPRYTQIWLVSFGAEERGFKGSLHFAKKYKKLLKEALIVNLDLVGAGRKSVIHTHEKFYGAKLSPEAVDFALKAAKRAGIDAIPYVAPAGGSDAAALCYHGLKATTIFNHAEDKWPPMWHNDTDRPENIDPGALENMIRLLEETVRESEDQSG